MQHSIAARRYSSQPRRLSTPERTVVILLVATVVLATVISSLGGQPTVETVSVKVRGGDTLWALAQKHPAPGLDTARTADLIAELNGLETSSLATGVTLRVPANNDAELAMR